MIDFFFGYNEQGNTSNKTPTQQFFADVITTIAIPVTAPLALSDLITSDFIEVLFQLGGN